MPLHHRVNGATGFSCDVRPGVKVTITISGMADADIGLKAVRRGASDRAELSQPWRYPLRDRYIALSAQ